MASPPILSPTGTTGFNRQSWQDSVEGATYQRIQFADTIDQYSGRLLNLGNIRKYARATASTLAQGDDGNSLTNSNVSGTPVTVSPTMRYVQVAWSAAERAQVDFDLAAGVAGQIEQALAEAVDTVALSNVASGTNTMSAAGFDVTLWRQAIGRIMGNTNGMFAPGDTGNSMIRAVISNTQYPNVMAIPEFTQAQLRGDNEDPLVKGIFTNGGGINVRFSTVVAQDGNGWHNPIYVQSAFVIAWNQRTKSNEEQVELLIRINVSNNFGVNVKHDGRFIDVRTTASGL